MVQRWKNEIILGLVLFGCSAFGGFFGAKMAQIDGPKPAATYDSSETFGTLPPPSESIPMATEPQPPVIVIVVNNDQASERQHERAMNAAPGALNPIQRPVNFI